MEKKQTSKNKLRKCKESEQLIKKHLLHLLKNEVRQTDEGRQQQLYHVVNRLSDKLQDQISYSKELEQENSLNKIQ